MTQGNNGSFLSAWQVVELNCVAQRSHNWNHEEIEQHMNPDMKQIILKKAFSIRDGENKYVWKYNHNAEYLVKSAYWMLMNEYNITGT